MFLEIRPSRDHNREMDTPQNHLDHIVSEGTRIYNERLRVLLEPLHLGEFVVIDVQTGAYEVDPDQMAAADRAEAKNPGASFYAAKIGLRTLGRIG